MPTWAVKAWRLSSSRSTYPLSFFPLHLRVFQQSPSPKVMKECIKLSWLQLLKEAMAIGVLLLLMIPDTSVLTCSDLCSQRAECMGLWIGPLSHILRNSSDESRSLESVKGLLRERRNQNNSIAAVIIEPTENGTGLTASDSFLKELHSLAKESEAALIVDERNSGCAVSGKGFWQY